MPEIPKFHEFMRPLLEVLRDQGGLARTDAIEAVVKKMGLSEEQVAVSQESNGNSLVQVELAGHPPISGWQAP